MSNVLVTKLPKYIVDHIKLYTGEGCWRNGKYINIHRIPKNDFRYSMLKKRRSIKQIKANSVDNYFYGCSWFKLENGKFVVINVGYMRSWIENHYVEGYIWEMHYNKEKITFNL